MVPSPRTRIGAALVTLLAVLGCRGHSSLPATGDAARDGVAPATEAGTDRGAEAASGPGDAGGGADGAGGVTLKSWLNTCYIDPSLGSGPGFTEAPECWYHLCLRFTDPDSGCLRQGCSAPCATDADCPAEAFCDPGKALSPTLQDQSVCRPGRRGAPPRSCADAGR